MRKLKNFPIFNPPGKGVYVFFPSLYIIIVVIVIIIGCVWNGKKKKHREGLEIRTFKIYYDIAWQCQPSLSYPHVHEVYTIVDELR